ncbi:hypothetical protein V3C99_002879 [Haemonchus contortus]
MSTAEAVIEATVVAATEPTAEAVTEITAEPSAETAAEPSTETAGKSTAEATREPAAETTTEKSAKTTTEPGAERKSTAQPSMDSFTETMFDHSRLDPEEHGSEKNKEEEKARCLENKRKDFIWIQSARGRKTLQGVLACIRECCIRLHLSNKCDLRLEVPPSQPIAERHFLAGKNGSDALKAYVTLLGDNVIQAEIILKNAKSAGGVFRAVAQPDVQWKLQQLQDLGNHIARVSEQACEVDARLAEISQARKFSLESGELLLSAARTMKDEILAARTTIILPRKKSLLELYNFPPTRRFNPPLPQDQLMSFYISSCKLVCASYHMVSKQTAPQGLSITVSECQLAYLEEVLQQLDNALAHLQRLIDLLDKCRTPLD